MIDLKNVLKKQLINIPILVICNFTKEYNRAQYSKSILSRLLRFFNKEKKTNKVKDNAVRPILLFIQLLKNIRCQNSSLKENRFIIQFA